MDKEKACIFFLGMSFSKIQMREASFLLGKAGSRDSRSQNGNMSLCVILFLYVKQLLHSYGLYKF
jgi:hypothetical protein